MPEIQEKRRPINLPAKLTRPRLCSSFLRTRLVNLLEQATHFPIVWIEAPPGAGKTTLAASWLDTDKVPYLWYQLDEGDNDFPTFFHYLGIAACHINRKSKKPLPVLTPEYLMGIKTFTRRYFEELGRRFKPGTVIVFDNAQDTGAAFYHLIGDAIDALPKTIQIVFLSRARPHEALARARLNGQMKVLGPEVMQLTLEESQGIAQFYGIKDQDIVASLFKQTRGWTAGFVLMLDQSRSVTAAVNVENHQTLFDYFAVEIFARIEPAAWDFLIKSALFSKIHAGDAGMLANYTEGRKVLVDLQRRNYFTYCLSSKDGVFEYHPLFREFLLSRLHATYPPDEIRRLQSLAARFQYEAGEIKEAAELWKAAGDFQAIAALIKAQARTFVAEGRTGVVASWLAILPGELIDHDPWLLYWLATTRFFIDPNASYSLFTKAYEGFQQGMDAIGVFLSWAGAVETIALLQKEFDVLDDWIEKLGKDNARFGEIPVPEIEIAVVTTVLTVISMHRPAHVEAMKWIEKGGSLCERIVDPVAKARMAWTLHYYFRMSGDYSRAHHYAAILREFMAGRRVDSITASLARMAINIELCVVGNFAQGIKATRATLTESAAAGMHILDSVHYMSGLIHALAAEDMQASDELLAGFEKAVSSSRSLEYATWLGIRSWRRRLAGDLEGALRDAQASAELCVGSGSYNYDIQSRQMYALALYARGEVDAASSENRKAYAMSRKAGFNFHLRCCALLNARIALTRGDELDAVDSLNEAFDLADRYDLGKTVLYWCRKDLAQIYAAALERDIHPDLLRSIIRDTGLTELGAAASIETPSWPWEVKIWTLGGFSLELNGEPLVFTGKIQRQPLALLKLLITLGGRDVAESRLADCLWPDTLGDAARTNLRSLIHRLRKLLGKETIVNENGRVGLDPKKVWLDMWILERRLQTFIYSNSESAMQPNLCGESQRLVELYTGPFLPEDDLPEVNLKREQLSAKFLSTIKLAGTALQQNGKFLEAIDFYEQCLEREPTKEYLYRELMRCHHALGDSADATYVFERCRKAIKTHYDREPLPDTQALMQSFPPSS